MGILHSSNYFFWFVKHNNHFFQNWRYLLSIILYYIGIFHIICWILTNLSIYFCSGHLDEFIGFSARCYARLGKKFIEAHGLTCSGFRCRRINIRIIRLVFFKYNDLFSQGWICFHQFRNLFEFRHIGQSIKSKMFKKFVCCLIK